METGKKKRRLSKRKIFNFIFFVTLIITVTSIAKFKTTYENSSNTRIAAGIIRLNSYEDNHLSVIAPTELDKSEEFLFDVTNVSNEGFVSDVTMKYYIEIEGLDTLPFIYTLYKYSEEIDDYEVVEINDGMSDGVVIAPTVAQYDKYKLIIEWDISNDRYKDYTYMKTLDYLSINISSEQVD